MEQDKVAPTLHFTLRAIYMRESRLWMAEGFNPLVPGQQLNGQFRTIQNYSCVETLLEGEGVATLRSCAFTTRFGFRYGRTPEGGVRSTEAADESDFLAEITADITVDYIIDTPNTPPPEELKKWGSSSVLLHAWPYWREYCHATMLRMNLPVSLMPMLVIAAPPTESPGSPPVVTTNKGKKAASIRKTKKPKTP